jgi:hypothetical protein
MLRRVATRRNIPEDTIFHSNRRKNLKSYIKCIHSLQYEHSVHTKVLIVAILSFITNSYEKEQRMTRL